MRPLTTLQRSILQFIQDHLKENGWPPSMREMSDHFRWNSTNAASDHLRRLSVKGYVVVAPRVSRGIRLTEKALEVLQVTP